MLVFVCGGEGGHVYSGSVWRSKNSWLSPSALKQVLVSAALNS